MALGMLAATFMDIQNSVAYRPRDHGPTSFYVDSSLVCRCVGVVVTCVVGGNCEYSFA